eukprot:SAG31_NODE_2133_length_6372_cov_4.372071_4_plen_410_part_00
MHAADRAKVRLLVGDREHLRRLSAPLPSRPLAADHCPPWFTSSSSRSSDEQEDHDHQDSKAERRRVQSSGSDGGMSTETIAIVLSVLVGAVGYVLQAHTARRAERVQEQQARELHIAEGTRQREHQMMTAQIERTHHALDQCCRPVQDDLFAIGFARLMMVAHLVGKLETSHPDAVTKMLAFANSVSYQKLGADGTVTDTMTSVSDGLVRWTPNPPAELTRAINSFGFAAPTGVSWVITNHDAYVYLSKPFGMEMPTAILEIIGAEPTGPIAEMGRRHVRHTLVPLVRRVAQTLREHAAYLELPPKSWLQQKFPGMNWKSCTNSAFVQNWFSYTLSYERLLLEWSDGNLESFQPINVQPFGGVFQTIFWSQARAEEKQAELIGMTSTAEVDTNSLFRRHAIGQASSENL